MIRLVWFVVAVLASLFKSKIRLEAENAALRHQLIVLRRTLRGRVRFTNHDRWFFVQLYRWFPSIITVLTIIRPATLVRWHRVGFRRYWRWKSRRRGGRPQIEADLRTLIRRMSIENSALGIAAHSRRIAQARLCRRSIQRRQIHGEAARAAKPGVAHLPAQPGAFIAVSRRAIANTSFGPLQDATAIDSVTGIHRTKRRGYCGASLKSQSRKARKAGIGGLLSG